MRNRKTSRARTECLAVELSNGREGRRNCSLLRFALLTSRKISLRFFVPPILKTFFCEIWFFLACDELDENADRRARKKSWWFLTNWIRQVVVENDGNRKRNVRSKRRPTRSIDCTRYSRGSSRFFAFGWLWLALMKLLLLLTNIPFVWNRRKSRLFKVRFEGVIFTADSRWSNRHPSSTNK